MDIAVDTDAGTAQPPAAPHLLPAPTLECLLGRADLWRGDRNAATQEAGIPTGHAGLDALLPGAGWPVGALVEILVDGAGIGHVGAAALGIGCGELGLLLPALARQTRAGGWGIVVAPPRSPHAPAWLAAGVDLSRLIVVAAEARDRLWAIDRCLRCAAVDLVLAWLPQVDASLLRRLQLAAEAGRSTLFAFRPAGVATQSSPAPLRLRVGGTSDGLQVHILKRRGPPLAAPLTLAVARPLETVPGRRRGYLAPPAVAVTTTAGPRRRVSA